MSPRVALLHGPESRSASTCGALSSSAFELRPTDDTATLIETLADGEATVAVVDRALLSTLDAEKLRQASELRGRPLPIVAVGCANGAEVDASLAAGAVLGVRSDASPLELRRLIESCAAEDEMWRSYQAARDDLARHQALAMKDDLTAAHNRRFFERCLDEEIERARRSHQPVGLIFMDIDNLREVNKQHGHATGSEVLREAAARTIRAVRAKDKVVRYGGDEFCIILPSTDWHGALDVAERVRQCMAGAPFAIEGSDGVMLTASFGIASYPEHGSTKVQLVKAADAAMSRIKDSQKNGILVATGAAP